MNGGWIKLHRRLIDWEWYNDLGTFRLFVHLLLIANHAPQKWRGKEIGRGQVLTSRSQLSEETGLSEKQVRTALERLKKTGEVAIKSTNRNSVISICKFDTYQATDLKKGQPEGQPEDQQGASKGPTIKQEGKNGKKGTCSNSWPERIYEAYPRQIERANALKKIRIALKSIEGPELLERVEAFANAVEAWPIEERQFIPYPASWFNKGRWEDDPREWIKQREPKTSSLIPVGI